MTTHTEEKESRVELFFSELKTLCEKHGVVELASMNGNGYTSGCCTVSFRPTPRADEYHFHFDGVVECFTKKINGHIRYRPCREGWKSIGQGDE